MPNESTDAVALRSPGHRVPWLAVLFCVLFGMAMAICIRGYQFGESNHNVYLVDGLRQASNNELLANDWFTTQTLQYHAAFTQLVKWLYRWNIIEPAFAGFYLALQFLLHLGWYRLVRQLGGSPMVYLASVVFYYLSAGGLGLGVYEFMQDRSFLPSNVANVAMLWGISLWLANRRILAGVALGLAGLMHLNHAIAGIVLWGCLVIGLLLDDVPARRLWRNTLRDRRLLVGSAALLLACVGNIGLALIEMWPKRDGLPFNEFIDLYVKLRHPHHYDPGSWPVALWITFLWPFPLAIWAYARRTRQPIVVQQAWQQAGRVFITFALMIAVAVIFAGVMYINDSLVKMSLFRFSIYLKLLSCIAAAWLMNDLGWLRSKPARIGWLMIALAIGIATLLNLPARLIDQGALAGAGTYVTANRVGLLALACLLLVPPAYNTARLCSERAAGGAALAGMVVAIAAIFLTWNHALTASSGNTANSHAALYAWVRQNTPADAVFLTSPGDQDFRLNAQRAIVVDLKGVAQLNAELAQWRNRMRDVLVLDNLLHLKQRTLDGTIREAGLRYNLMTEAHLSAVAGKYGARYIVIGKPLETLSHQQVFADTAEGYVYDLQK